LTAIDLPGTDDDTVYRYDDCPNGQGWLCSVERGATLVRYRYDGWGQIAALTQQVQDANGTLEAAVQLEYDPGGRISALVYPSGATVRYRYDAAGQVIAITLEHQGEATELLTPRSYQLFGPLKAAQLGNGLSWTKQTDLAYRPIELTDGPYRAVLDYDLAGNIRALQTPDSD